MDRCDIDDVDAKGNESNKQTPVVIDAAKSDAGQ